LARGVYGQRQEGVQMIRIKLPFGKVTSEQLVRISKVSDEYSRGRLHITTRQDIQIHFVSLDRTPELWAELEKDDITLREACGNTVRNIYCPAKMPESIPKNLSMCRLMLMLCSISFEKPSLSGMGRNSKYHFRLRIKIPL